MSGENNNEKILLEVDHLSVVINAQTILRDISFRVKSGEALAVIGPNGAGKTMLFRALLGLVPREGVVRWRKGIRIGYVPQRLAIEKNMPLTGREFFLLKARNFWFPKRSFLDHLHHELTLVGLAPEILSRRIGELSGGELQRLLIAWAMINHPEVLLFDEPTAGIDLGFAETIYHLMHRLQDERGTTILLISHDLNVVYRYAQSVLCINQRMICHGPPQEVLHPAELAQIYGDAGFYHHEDGATSVR